jgi:hypothetical protein
VSAPSRAFPRLGVFGKDYAYPLEWGSGLWGLSVVAWKTDGGGIAVMSARALAVVMGWIEKAANCVGI